jgi:predicted HAD superfamily Cof-like phosphohydrolase
MSNFKKVKNFMETFRQDVKNRPSFPSEKIISLRCSLIEEELSELKDAVRNRDIIEIKKILKQKFKNYNFSNKVLSVSKTI